VPHARGVRAEHFERKLRIPVVIRAWKDDDNHEWARL
jgi:hypothetical protein